MRDPGIGTRIFLPDLDFEVYLQVVPNVGEKMMIKGVNYYVKERVFYLHEEFEGTMSLGHRQSCGLFLK